MLLGTLSYTLSSVEKNQFKVWAILFLLNTTVLRFKLNSAGFGLCFVVVLLESKCIRYREVAFRSFFLE